MVPVKGRVIEKGGRPFLLIPSEPGTATAVLSLYAAQSSLARVAKMLLTSLLSASLPFGSKPVVLHIASQARFVGFLRSLVGVRETDLPVFGGLAGNPGEEGQRLLLLVFEDSRRPAAVVKVGLSARAQVLVQKEQTFLASVGPGVKGIPKLRGWFEAAHLRAMATDYVPGETPRGDWDDKALSDVLGAWIGGEQKVLVTDTVMWSRLQPKIEGHKEWSGAVQPLMGRTVRPVIQHGDLAPWNIKVARDGTWTVLDWERGELSGIPAWDWFHYALQPAILVQRRSTALLIETVEALLSSAEFQRYVAQTDISGLERALVLSYLMFMVEVIKPAQGSQELGQLLNALLGRWRQT